MIHCTSKLLRYQTRFSDGVYEAIADAPADKGGTHSGFLPHDLLEAALASCINITVRMYADHHAIPLRAVTTRASIDHSRPDDVVFRYGVDLDGELTSEQQDKLLLAAHACPIRRIMSKAIRFESDLKAPSP